MENKRQVYLKFLLLNTIVYGLVQFVYNYILNKEILITEILFQSLIFGILMSVIIIETGSYKFRKKNEDSVWLNYINQVERIVS
jgi:uncharacterized membrane protein